MTFCPLLCSKQSISAVHLPNFQTIVGSDSDTLCQRLTITETKRVVQWYCIVQIHQITVEAKLATGKLLTEWFVIIFFPGASDGSAIRGWIHSNWSCSPSLLARQEEPSACSRMATTKPLRDIQQRYLDPQQNSNLHWETTAKKEGNTVYVKKVTIKQPESMPESVIESKELGIIKSFETFANGYLGVSLI